jgi:peroxiredoxin
MPLDRREFLTLGLVGVAASVAGIVAGPLTLQSQSGAAALLGCSFPDLSGRHRRILEWAGSVAVCNFWATWCAPCREEVPLLVAFREKFVSQGSEVLGIGIDQLGKIREFAVNYKISYPLLVADASAFELLPRLGNRAAALPYTVVLDRRGAVAYRKLGALQEGELDDVVTRLLR